MSAPEKAALLAPDVLTLDQVLHEVCSCASPFERHACHLKAERIVALYNTKAESGEPRG